jgi:hypothetical protein
VHPTDLVHTDWPMNDRARITRRRRTATICRSDANSSGRFHFISMFPADVSFVSSSEVAIVGDEESKSKDPEASAADAVTVCNIISLTLIFVPSCRRAGGSYPLDLLHTDWPPNERLMVPRNRQMTRLRSNDANLSERFRFVSMFPANMTLCQFGFSRNGRIKDGSQGA